MLLRVPKQYLVIKVYNRECMERKISFSLQVGGIRFLSLSIQHWHQNRSNNCVWVFQSHPLNTTKRPLELHGKHELRNDFPRLHFTFSRLVFLQMGRGRLAPSLMFGCHVHCQRRCRAVGVSILGHCLGDGLKISPQTDKQKYRSH